MGIGRDIHCSISGLVVKPIVAIDGLRGQFTADTKLVILLGDVRFWDILPRIPPSPPCVCVCDLQCKHRGKKRRPGHTPRGPYEIEKIQNRLCGGTLFI